MGEGNSKPGGRQALDEIMGRMAEPDFNVRHRRVLEIPETGAHVSPEMLAIAAALIDGDNETVDELTKQALDAGTEALEIMDNGLIAGMGIGGQMIRQGEVIPALFFGLIVCGLGGVTLIIGVKRLVSEW